MIADSKVNVAAAAVLGMFMLSVLGLLFLTSNSTHQLLPISLHRSRSNNGILQLGTDNAGTSPSNNHRSLEVVSDFSDPRSVTTKFNNQIQLLQDNLPPPPVVPNAHPTFELLLEQYILDSERSNYLINIGARDGKYHDPTYPLLYSGYDGILFEGDEESKKDLYDNIAALPHFKTTQPFISWGFVSPDTVLQRLSEGGARKDADVLKMDIDSFDAHLMETILEGGYQPKVVMVEFNPDVPPPLAWHQLYSTHPHGWGKVVAGHYGATASAWHEIMTEKFGYGLVGMEVSDRSAQCPRCEHNMWYVSKEFLNRRGYRTTTHQEMVELFWKTHYADKLMCIHARRPCLLVPPKAENDMQKNIEVSLMLSESDISCATWKTYKESVVQSWLAQMDKACRCKECSEGDPCLQSWHVHTKKSNIC